MIRILKRRMKNGTYSFRLLNSEIGNDPSNVKTASEWGLRPENNAQKAGQKHPAFQRLVHFITK